MNDPGSRSETTAREEILARIRAALPGEPASVTDSYLAITRSYQRHGTLDRAACVELLIDRLVDYDSEVIRVSDEQGIVAAISSSMKRASETRLLLAPAVPAQWLPEDISLVIDDAASIVEIDSADAVLTSCEAAVASTGTIFLIHDGAQGRRVSTLLPDHHICVIREDQIYETVPEAFASLEPHDLRPLTTISGPSATSDIEMTRIRGVHGPRRLTVILCSGS